MRFCPLFICENPRCIGLTKNIDEANQRLAGKLEEYHERRITEEND